MTSTPANFGVDKKLPNQYQLGGGDRQSVL
jgi:hypothetical protein